MVYSIEEVEAWKGERNQVIARDIREERAVYNRAVKPANVDFAEEVWVMETSEMTALKDVLVELSLQLESICLDPNNPRFIDEKATHVDLHNVTDSGVQELTMAKLFREYGVEKLAASMRVNGYLPIDRIVVKRLPEPNDQKFVVLEGNRRIAAAKSLSSLIAMHVDYTSESVKASLVSIPCLEYTGSDVDAAWIFQGLRHISGISDWPAYNKARLLVEQIDRDGLSFTQAGERFGLSAYGAGQWARGYYAYKQALEETDFVREVHVDAYPYFQELFGRSSVHVRNWLDWDNDNNRFVNVMNYNEFISWLYPRINEESRPDEYGDFERRYIRTRDDIRQLSFIYSTEPDLFEKFRREKNLELVYAESMSRKFERDVVDREKSIIDQLTHCKNGLDSVPFRLMQSDQFKNKLRTSLISLMDSINALGLLEH